MKTVAMMAFAIILLFQPAQAGLKVVNRSDEPDQSVHGCFGWRLGEELNQEKLAEAGNTELSPSDYNGIALTEAELAPVQLKMSDDQSIEMNITLLYCKDKLSGIDLQTGDLTKDKCEAVFEWLNVMQQGVSILPSRDEATGAFDAMFWDIPSGGANGIRAVVLPGGGNIMFLDPIAAQIFLPELDQASPFIDDILKSH